MIIWVTGRKQRPNWPAGRLMTQSDSSGAKLRPGFPARLESRRTSATPARPAVAQPVPVSGTTATPVVQRRGPGFQRGAPKHGGQTGAAGHDGFRGVAGHGQHRAPPFCRYRAGEPGLRRHQPADRSGTNHFQARGGLPGCWNCCTRADPAGWGGCWKSAPVAVTRRRC